MMDGKLIMGSAIAGPIQHATRNTPVSMLSNQAFMRQRTAGLLLLGLGLLSSFAIVVFVFKQMKKRKD